MMKWLSLCLLLGACTGESAPEEPPSGQPSGGAEGAGGFTTINNSPNVQKCGTEECSEKSDCCTEGELCGRVVHTEVFASSCIAEENRGGELSASCPESPEYCFLRGCKSYQGCTLQGGECGYWVDGYEIVGGVEVIVVNLDLGCMSPEEMATQ